MVLVRHCNNNVHRPPHRPYRYSHGLHKRLAITLTLESMPCICAEHKRERLGNLSNLLQVDDRPRWLWLCDKDVGSLALQCRFHGRFAVHFFPLFFPVTSCV